LAEVNAVMDGQSGPEEDRLLLTLPEPLRHHGQIRMTDRRG
jgi:hypothetical protein